VLGLYLGIGLGNWKRWEGKRRSGPSPVGLHAPQCRRPTGKRAQRRWGAMHWDQDAKGIEEEDWALPSQLGGLFSIVSSQWGPGSGKRISVKLQLENCIW